MSSNQTKQQHTDDKESNKQPNNVLSRNGQLDEKKFLTLSIALSLRISNLASNNNPTTVGTTLVEKSSSNGRSKQQVERQHGGVRSSSGRGVEREQ